MPRIRTMKPEFWNDEKLAPMEPIDRLVFLGLIGMADDLGRLLDSVKVIDAFIFPYTNHTCASSLDVLANASRITRGVTASGQRVIQIVNWSKHQKVDRPTLKACFPELVESQEVATPREDVATDSRPNRAPTYDLRPTTDEDEQLPHSVWLAFHPFGNDPKTRTARYGAVLGLLQGMTAAPIPEATMARALEDMQVAGVPFTRNVLVGFCRKAEEKLQGEAGVQAAQESLRAVRPVSGQPRANQRPSEDDLE